MKYNIKWLETTKKKLDGDIQKAFSIYENIFNSKFSWQSFIDYQNILTDSLFYLKKNEFKIKAKLKDIKNKSNTYYKEKNLKSYLETFKIIENRIKVLGDFLAWVLYLSNEDLIDNHIMQKPVGIHSIGSGTFAEIEFIKRYNKEDEPYFYLYNNITSFLRLGDVSVYSKSINKIVGYGEIKSSKPDKDSVITIDVTITSKYNLASTEKNEVVIDKKRDFLTDKMKQHLEKQLKVMDENLVPNKPDNKADIIVDYHYKDLELLLEECEIKGSSYRKVSENVMYISCRDDFDFENKKDIKDVIDLELVKQIVNPNLSNEKIIFTNISGLSNVKTIPFLLLPISNKAKKQFLSQNVIVIYSQANIINEAKKMGFEYKNIKGNPSLVRREEKKETVLPLSYMFTMIYSMFLDEESIVSYIKKISNVSIPLKDQRQGKVIMQFANLVNKK